MTIAKKVVIREDGQKTVRVMCIDNAGTRYEVSVDFETVFVGSYENAMKKYQEV